MSSWSLRITISFVAMLIWSIVLIHDIIKICSGTASTWLLVAVDQGTSRQRNYKVTNSRCKRILRSTRWSEVWTPLTTRYVMTTKGFDNVMNSKEILKDYIIFWLNIHSRFYNIECRLAITKGQLQWSAWKINFINRARWSTYKIVINMTNIGRDLDKRKYTSNDFYQILFNNYQLIIDIFPRSCLWRYSFFTASFKVESDFHPHVGHQDVTQWKEPCITGRYWISGHVPVAR